MKKNILLIFLLVFITSYSQQKQFNIAWESTKVLFTSDSKIEVPAFNEENFAYNHDSGLLFITQWESDRFVNERSLEISNINYRNISRADLKDFELSTIPSEPKYSIHNSTTRNKNFIYFELSPIVKDGNTYKKITSLNINYSFSSGNQESSFRSIQAITNSVLNSGSWYKFYIDKTGIFKLSKSFLSSLGADLNNIEKKLYSI